MTKHEPFIMLPYRLYDSPAFAALQPTDIAVLLMLLRHFNGTNNGKIALGVRAVAKGCHCGKTTASRALATLRAAGFIEMTHKGHLVPEFSRPNIATRWLLTFVKNQPTLVPNDTSRAHRSVPVAGHR
jgi:hypothetical protein